MTKRRGHLAVLAGLMALAAWGCQSKPINVPPLTAQDVPALTALGNYPDRIYKIEPGDTLQIRYVYHPELKQEDIVRPDGKITVNLIGEIQVLGMTTTELERLLARRSTEFVRDPEVIVSISKFSDKHIFVGGEVGRPGTLPYRKGLTPLQAVIAAGGFRDTARLDSVILVRMNGTRDEVMSRRLNLDEIVRDGGLEPVALAPNDVIFVPRSEIADANLWVRQHIVDLIPFFRGYGMGTTVPLF
jgi:protein involved in polysaccharide export with SLBB domain